MFNEVSYTVEEVKKHRTRKDLWVILDNHVLDITKYIEHHPGGIDIMTEYSGQDISDVFDKIGHSNKAYKIALKFKIGNINSQK